MPRSVPTSQRAHRRQPACTRRCAAQTGRLRRAPGQREQGLVQHKSSQLVSQAHSTVAGVGRIIVDDMIHRNRPGKVRGCALSSGVRASACPLHRRLLPSLLYTFLFIKSYFSAQESSHGATADTAHACRAPPDRERRRRAGATQARGPAAGPRGPGAPARAPDMVRVAPGFTTTIVAPERG